MKKIKLSRASEVDTQKCVENFGGNRFELVISAANRAREIAQRNKEGKKFLEPDPIITALLEIQNKEL